MSEQTLNNSQQQMEDENEALIEQIAVLLEEKNLRELKNLLNELEPFDVAWLLSRSPQNNLPLMFRLLPKELAADTFVEMDSDMQQILLASFSDMELEAITDELYADDMVNILEEMPANVVSRMLRLVPPERRQMINELLKYPANSAGSLMTTEYVELREFQTVAQAFETIRRRALDTETVYT